jgi:ABC-type sugar transport system ATPase subunit
MAEKLLELRNISKRFGGVLALDSVDFEIEKGEAIAWSVRTVREKAL